MKTETESLRLIDNEEDHRFELPAEGGTAYIEYKQKGDKIFLIHTEIPREMNGRAVAPALVEKVFSLIESRGQKMVPYCPFVKAYLKRHPEWERITA
jgi:predicted GNAT family acetyltransferase